MTTNPNGRTTDPLRPAETAAMIIASGARRDLDAMRAKVRAILALPWLHDELQQIVGCLLVLHRRATAGTAPHSERTSWLRQTLETMRTTQPTPEGELWANLLALDVSRGCDIEGLAKAQHSCTKHVTEDVLRDTITAMADNLWRHHHRDTLARPLSGMARIRAFYGVPAKRGMHVFINGQRGVITGSRRGTMQLWVVFDGAPGSVPAHPTWRAEYVTDPGPNPESAGQSTCHPVPGGWDGREAG